MGGSDGDVAFALRREVTELESRLERARKRLAAACDKASPQSAPVPTSSSSVVPTSSLPPPEPLAPQTHFLLLLSDSALPLGAFAFSSGLESYLAHTRGSSSSSSSSSFAAFLPLSVSAYASTALPFALAGHRDPSALPSLDDALDAAIVCAVGRRASVAQGRALLSVWERCFAPGAAAGTSPASAIASFAAAVKAAAAAPSASLPPAPSAHLAPLFGAVCAAVGIDAEQAAFVFMLSHVKALVSAAVRAGVFGPYQAQRLLAGAEVRRLVGASVRREWDTRVEDAGQSVPLMDLWVGRHEMLYSRIFNS